jgi:hypothetical protein
MRSRQERCDGVLDHPRVAVVGEAGRKLPQDAGPRSTSRKSSAPVSDVIVPPSNRAVT